jgi:hypothetical protein
MVWPAVVTVVGEAVFSTASPGDAGAVTVAVDGSEVTAGPDGGVPDAVAVFVIEPASMSACVTVYVPVQVMDACGAKVDTGHESTGGVPVPENDVSAALTFVSVVLPVLVTRAEYVTVWPAVVTADGEAVFSTASPGDAGTVTVAVDGFDVTAGPDGGVPDAVAVSVTPPASTSACVIVYVPEQVVDAPGANVVTGQETTGGGPEPENDVSAAFTFVSVELPVLVTMNE